MLEKMKDDGECSLNDEHFEKYDDNRAEWKKHKCQDVEDFKYDAYCPERLKQTIYIQPFDDFEEGPSVEALREYTQIFFQMNVEVCKPLGVSLPEKFLCRTHPRYKGKQVLTTDLINHLNRQNRGEDEFCVIGMTKYDLYPKPSWNFVFGQAWPKERAGVFSFNRYEKDESVSTLKRSMNVLTHELAHLFGVEHCWTYKCGMNGSNNLEEASARPLHLCPIDHAKLEWALDFDPLKRYHELAYFYGEHGFYDEAILVRKRLNSLLGD